MKVKNRVIASVIIAALLITSGIQGLAEDNASPAYTLAGEGQSGEGGSELPGEEVELPSSCDHADESLGCCNFIGEDEEITLDEIEIIEVEMEEDVSPYQAIGAVYIDWQIIYTPEEQFIAVFFENEELTLTSATLVTTSVETGEEFSHDAINMVDHLVLFSIVHGEDSQEGEKQVERIEYTIEGREEPLEVVFEDQNIELSYLVTHTPAFGEEEAGIVVHGFGEDGEIVSEETTVEEIAETIEEVLEMVDESVYGGGLLLEDHLDAFVGIAPTSAGIAPTTAAVPASTNRIIVVSAGHCATHVGASANGLNEHELTWHVAGVVVNELNRFAGITAHRDRPTIQCRYFPNVWTTEASNHCLTQRIRDARAIGATVFVDIHFNASEATSANGAEVWIPHAGNNDGRHQEGLRLSNEILRNLATLGLTNRGHRTQVNNQGTDWFATNRIARELGMTGIIVEGGFLTNTADANRLRDPNFRHNLGVQIARGIAAAYNAPLAPPTSTTTATNVNGQEIFFDLRATIANVPNISRVEFAVWNHATGQRDLIWYTGAHQPNGSWTARADVRRHTGTGRYNVHTWITLTNGQQIFASSTTFNVTAIRASKSFANININAGTFDVVISGIVAPAGVTQVRVPVWTRADRSDLRWNTAVRQANGSFRVTINVAHHNFHVGTYHVQAHIHSANGLQGTITSTHNVAGRPQATVTATNRNGTQTFYDMRLTNAAVFGTLTRVQFAVWSHTNGQNDLIWYNGTQSGGVWTATADVRRHRYPGRYNVHVWGTRTDGSKIFMASTTFNVTAPSGTIRVANANPNAGTFDVIVSGIIAPSGVTRVQIPVWSQPNQSDIVWYEGVRFSDGSFRTTVRIANHNFNIGRYHVHAHIITNNGFRHIVNTSHNVTTRPTATVTSTNRNGTETLFDLRASNVELLGSFNRVQFAVWSQNNGQNDLIWYNGTQSGGVWTATADVRRHRYPGTYHVHVWGTRPNGSKVFLASTTFNVTAPSGTIRIVNNNPNAGTFDVIVSGIRAPSGVTQVQIPIWTRPDQSDIVWYQGVRFADGSFRTTVRISNHNNNRGRYQVHAHIITGNGFRGIIRTTHDVGGPTTVGLISIMGQTQTNVAQMVRNYRNTGHTFPQAALGMSLESFAQLVLNEANREGVRAEVLWTQVMRETGWLQFGGDVRISQFNFGGLGATGGGNPGHSFPSVQIGLRAQVHHLVAYATTAPVRFPSNTAHPVLRTEPPWGPTGETRVNGTESPRFHFVPRGIAPYVNWLGQGENPNHPGFWAADRQYGARLAEAIRVLLNS